MDNQLDNGTLQVQDVQNEPEKPEVTDTNTAHADIVSMASHEDYEKSFQEIQRNDYLSGKVVKIENDGVYVDIGWKREGYIPLNQLSHRPISTPESEVTVGEEIPVIVLKVDDMEGELILSKKRADLETAWRRVVEAYEKGEVITATAVEAVKGGLLVDLGLRGFVPASQVDTRPVKDLDEFVGDALRLRVIELDPSRRKVVLSRKKVLEEERVKMKETTLSSLYEGQIVKGNVARLTNFGAFINLGGVDGLVHISEMAWKRIKHPSEVLKVGQPIDVMVLKVDSKRERISLSVRQAMPDPWLTVDETVGVDNVVKGRITKIAKKYVFVEVLDGVEGVVPIHEVSDDKMVKTEELFKEGQEIEIRVLEIKKEARRMLLSLKQVNREASRKEMSSFMSSSSSSGSGATIGDILRAKKEEQDAEKKEPVKIEEVPELPKAAVETKPAPERPVEDRPARPPIPGLEPEPIKLPAVPAAPKLSIGSVFEDKVPEIEKIPIENLDAGTEVDAQDSGDAPDNSALFGGDA